MHKVLGSVPSTRVEDLMKSPQKSGFLFCFVSATATFKLNILPPKQSFEIPTTRKFALALKLLQYLSHKISLDLLSNHVLCLIGSQLVMQKRWEGGVFVHFLTMYITVWGYVPMWVQYLRCHEKHLDALDIELYPVEPSWHKCYELNSGSQQEQYALLTSGQFFSPRRGVLILQFPPFLTTGSYLPKDSSFPKTGNWYNLCVNLIYVSTKKFIQHLMV